MYAVPRIVWVATPGAAVPVKILVMVVGVAVTGGVTVTGGVEEPALLLELPPPHPLMISIAAVTEIFCRVFIFSLMMDEARPSRAGVQLLYLGSQLRACVE